MNLKQSSLVVSAWGREYQVIYGMLGRGESLNDYDVEIYSVYKHPNGKRNLINRLNHEEIAALYDRVIDYEMDVFEFQYG